MTPRREEEFAENLGKLSITEVRALGGKQAAAAEQAAAAWAQAGNAREAVAGQEGYEESQQIRADSRDQVAGVIAWENLPLEPMSEDMEWEE